jgi:hypothetical protein
MYLSFCTNRRIHFIYNFVDPVRLRYKGRLVYTIGSYTFTSVIGSDYFQLLLLSILVKNSSPATFKIAWVSSVLKKDNDDFCHLFYHKLSNS